MQWLILLCLLLLLLLLCLLGCAAKQSRRPISCLDSCEAGWSCSSCCRRCCCHGCRADDLTKTCIQDPPACNHAILQLSESVGAGCHCAKRRMWTQEHDVATPRSPLCTRTHFCWMLPEFVVYIYSIMQLRVCILTCRLTEQPGIVDGRRQHCQLDAAGAHHSTGQGGCSCACPHLVPCNTLQHDAGPFLFMCRLREQPSVLARQLG